MNSEMLGELFQALLRNVSTQEKCLQDVLTSCSEQGVVHMPGQEHLQPFSDPSKTNEPEGET